MREIFVNLPVADVARTRRFWSEAGFEINERFSDEQAVCVAFSDHGFGMMLGERFFRRFIDDEIVPTSQGTQVICAIGATSRDELDGLRERVLAAGGSEHHPREPVEMEGMEGFNFADPDGHVWEVLWMEATDG